MLTTVRAVFCLGALAIASAAAAQDARLVTITPADPPRWDVALQVGWLGGNKSAIAPDWNDWYDTASFDLSAGYYSTAHLKFELGLSATGAGRVVSDEIFELPGSPFPSVRSSEHRFRTTSVAAGATYQFFENAWFHPFAGGGVALVYEDERVRPGQPFFFRDPRTGAILPDQEPVDRQSTAARPFATFGFKAYVSERVFARSDLRVTASAHRAETVVWRGGFGIDF